MARLFPFRSEASTGERRPRVVDLGDEDADAVFSALSSTTAREIYATLNEDPGTPSDVAEAIDSSIQNVRYHLEKLEEAGLVEVVDTWYSSRGNEMSVYATTDGPLIVTSDRSTADRLKTALSRYLGGIAALAGGSLLVQYSLERYYGGETAGSDWFSWPGPADDTDDGDGGSVEDDGNGADANGDAANGGAANGDAANGDGVAEDDADANGSEDVEETGSDREFEGASDGGTDTAGDTAGNDAPTGGTDAIDGVSEGAEAVFAAVPPGLLFFLGGLAVLTAVTLYWYWRTY